MRNATCTALLFATAICATLALSVDTPRAQGGEPDKTITSGASLNDRIDAEINKVLKRDGIKPTKPSDDEEFLRRVYLDTVGVPPGHEEAVAFLDSNEKNKRAKLIDTLIADPRFGYHMADQWTVLLTPRDARALSGSHLFAQWFAAKVNSGVGMHTIIREIVTAEGRLADNPSVVPYFADGGAVRFTDMIGKLTRSLMGVQVQCAECHDHPYDEELTQAGFQGMAAFMTATRPVVDNSYQPARTYVETDPRPARRVLDAFEKYDQLNKEQRAQVDQYIDFVRPVTLDGERIDTRDPSIWRGKLAAWMIGGDNEQTRLYVANRVWSIAFGIGLVNPVDDFNPFNVASHPELLKLLADDLLDSGWSIKRLYRAILNSETYQRSSRDMDEKAEKWHFAGYPVRHLNAEQFLGTLLNLLAPDQLNELVQQNRDAGLDRYIEQLKQAEKQQEKADNPNMRRYRYDIPTLNRYAEQFKAMDGRWFLTRWSAGRYTALASNNEETSGESFTMSITQALAVMNGEFTNALAREGDQSLLNRIAENFESYEDRIEALYLTVLSRRPDKAERKNLKAYFRNAEDPTAAAEDLLFALLMTTEFATNH